MRQAPPACCAATRRADRAGDTMHLVTPFPNIVFALDLTKPGAHVKWRFDPKADAGSRPFFNMLDGKTIALDAASGHDFWRTRSARVRRKLLHAGDPRAMVRDARAAAMRVLIFALLAATAAGVGAHDPGGADGWRMSTWGAALLAVTAAGYAFGVARLWRSAGVGRGITRLQAAAFGAGWLASLLALLPPLDTWSQRLFSVHMVQHELLMVIAAPLLVLGTPLAAWSWAWPAGARAVRGAFARPLPAALWTRLTAPLGAWLVHAVVLWSWHVPRLFESALANEGVHELQHASFIAAALLFWWSVLNPRVVRGSPGAALLSLFTTMLHTGLLGALLALSGRSWYPAYGPLALAAGVDPVWDQQLGGLLMWVPGSVAYLAAALYVAARLLGRDRGAPLEARS